MASETATFRPQDVGLYARLATTPLARAGGAVLIQLLDAAWLAALRREADAQASIARPNRIDAASPDTAAAGDPMRWLDSAPGGAVLDAFYREPAVFEVLASLTGLAWTTTGDRGSFSYYRQPGHYLGLHLDIEECEVAVITCVADDGALDGGVLCLYPGRVGEPLAQISASLNRGAVPVRVGVGQSLVLLGGLVPHRLTPVGRGQSRIITPLCYRVSRSVAHLPP